jgi:hypothetical protein
MSGKNQEILRYALNDNRQLPVIQNPAQNVRDGKVK